MHSIAWYKKMFYRTLSRGIQWNSHLSLVFSKARVYTEKLIEQVWLNIFFNLSDNHSVDDRYLTRKAYWSAYPQVFLLRNNIYTNSNISAESFKSSINDLTIPYCTSLYNIYLNFIQHMFSGASSRYSVINHSKAPFLDPGTWVVVL